MKTLSIVVPCHNEQETIPLFFKTVESIINDGISNVMCEYWFIDDGSTDGTITQLKKMNYKNPQKVHFISFSRNFGKESAMYAGLQATKGEYVVVMDVDLQDPPELLPKMVDYLNSGKYDCVATRRINRDGEPIISSFFANAFYRLINKISNTNIVNGARDYRMMTRQMVDAIISLSEYNRFSKGLFSWVGFRTVFIEYPNIKRVAGHSNWSFRKLFRYSIDGITDFSEVPLSIASWTGVLSFIIAIIGLFFIVIRAIVIPSSSVSGWASMTCIILLIGGLQLLCLGIVGKYVGKIYLQSKNRPIYIVREKK